MIWPATSPHKSDPGSQSLFLAMKAVTTMVPGMSECLSLFSFIKSKTSM